MLLDLEKLRQEYAERTLDASDADPDPFRQLEHWLADALEAGLPEPNAMTLATCTPDGKPSARVVLLKGIEGGGLDFYTNYESRKGRELEENPRAAVVFLWLELQRQLRVEGRVERVSEEQSSRYFQSRPIGSQIGAAASPQSRIMNDRAELERNFAELEKQYNEAGHISRPPHWGGYRIIPDCFEFWQGRRSRLHDRLQYALDAEGKWRLERLAP
ncbi:MAG: pyridoxamine 5'-phosphate oxidase [Saprospiraceae bacterium]|nr:pyridoxamine 5'-phosphate oxidase [Saprospiraceae bacterium]